jgi:hypothetical protein
LYKGRVFVLDWQNNLFLDASHTLTAGWTRGGAGESRNT